MTTALTCPQVVEANKVMAVKQAQRDKLLTEYQNVDQNAKDAAGQRTEILKKIQESEKGVAEDLTALLNAAVALAKQQRAAHIELRQSEVLGLGWPVKQHKVSMRLELPKHFETLWEGFPPKLRSQVRRARKAGMIVRSGGDELLDDFYRLLARNMRDLGTPVHARGVFEAFLKARPDETRICVVSMAGQPMAAGFLYGFREVLEIPWAAADRRHKELSANMLLYSAALEFGCGAGYRVFDFGRSTPGSGTYHFKQQWGATPFPLHWYYWLSNGGALPEISPQNPKFRLAIEVWKRLPVMITQIVGPAIVRNIP